LNKALFEIGVEDLPPTEFDNINEQLDSNLRESLKKSNITFDKLEIFITPRRFGVYIEGLPLKQPDQKEERKGPPKSICFNEQNQSTKALEGFAKSVGVPLEEIRFKDFNGSDYAYAELVKKGESTKKVLENIIPEVITKMTFKKPMRWGTGEFSFVRPVHWILGLYNGEILSFEIFGKKSSNISYGHRFFGEKIVVNRIDNFFDQLRNQNVIPFYEERIQQIKKEIERLEKENKITIFIQQHKDLVEEIAKMTEFPTAVLGSFNEKNLFLPPEIVTVTIKHHQRSFVAFKNGKLLNIFISFQDGFGREQNVINGYTRVINARLDDAAFYFEDDLKVDIEERLTELSEITYQRELGSYRDKVERISRISEKIAQMLNFKNLSTVKRAGLLCKIDIPSKVVYEFPELQGVMGRIYLQHKGEEEDVYITAEEHYKPISENDEISTNLISNIVSLSDRLDDLVGYFGINKIPTGSKDPFGLRRKTFGILRILISLEWDLDLNNLFNIAQQTYLETNRQDVSLKGKEEVLKDFVDHRLATILEKEDISKEAINAVLINSYKPLRAYLSAKALDEFLKKEEFQDFLIAFQRVNNISKNHNSLNYQGRLFIEEEEKILFQKYLDVKSRFEEHIKKLDYSGAIETLLSLKENIDRYFDHVFVMSEDEAIRLNRLGFLKNLAMLFYEIGDIEKLYKG